MRFKLLHLSYLLSYLNYYIYQGQFNPAWVRNFISNETKLECLHYVNLCTSHQLRVFLGNYGFQTNILLSMFQCGLTWHEGGQIFKSWSRIALDINMNNSEINSCVCGAGYNTSPKCIRMIFFYKQLKISICMFRNRRIYGFFHKNGRR